MSTKPGKRNNKKYKQILENKKKNKKIMIIDKIITIKEI
jgi:hypothetical protein